MIKISRIQGQAERFLIPLLFFDWLSAEAVLYRQQQ